MGSRCATPNSFTAGFAVPTSKLPEVAESSLGRSVIQKQTWAGDDIDEVRSTVSCTSSNPKFRTCYRCKQAESQPNTNPIITCRECRHRYHKKCQLRDRPLQEVDEASFVCNNCMQHNEPNTTASSTDSITGNGTLDPNTVGNRKPNKMPEQISCSWPQCKTTFTPPSTSSVLNPLCKTHAMTSKYDKAKEHAASAKSGASSTPINKSKLTRLRPEDRQYGKPSQKSDQRRRKDIEHFLKRNAEIKNTDADVNIPLNADSFGHESKALDSQAFDIKRTSSSVKSFNAAPNAIGNSIKNSVEFAPTVRETLPTRGERILASSNSTYSTPKKVSSFTSSVQNISSIDPSQLPNSLGLGVRSDQDEAVTNIAKNFNQEGANQTLSTRNISVVKPSDNTRAKIMSVQALLVSPKYSSSHIDNEDAMQLDVATEDSSFGNEQPPFPVKERGSSMLLSAHGDATFYALSDQRHQGPASGAKGSSVSVIDKQCRNDEKSYSNSPLIPLEILRAERAETYDPSELDQFLWKQATQKSRCLPTADELLKTQIWGHADPRKIWNEEFSPAWMEEKRAEIAARGSRKANFGQVLTKQNIKERKERGWSVHQTSEKVPLTSDQQAAYKWIERAHVGAPVQGYFPTVIDGELRMVKSDEPEVSSDAGSKNGRNGLHIEDSGTEEDETSFARILRTRN